jgi:hypothetical protein
VLDQATIDKLKKDNAGVELLHVSAPIMGETYEAVLRTPGSGEWARFMAQNRDDARKAQSFAVLLAACRVWPDAPAFQVMLDKRPGLNETFGAKLTAAAGLAQEAEVKKL